MESFEDMQSRHRKEQKDLQSRLTQKKRSATKKTRKGVNFECEELERLLKEKQGQEIAALNEDSVPDIDDVPELEEPPQSTPTTNGVNGVNGVTESLDKTTISETTPSEDGQHRKRNRQKERLARRAAEQEVAVGFAKSEASNQPDPRAIEHAKLQNQFKSHNLVEKLIRPDGHCLFAAVADQLQQVGIPLGADSDRELNEGERYKVVRKAAARYIEGHSDEFVGFMDEALNTYVEKIRDTAEWGGHLELIALAKTYNVEICVLQDGGPQTIQPGEGKGTEKIWLAFYRHGFGLGEHYNSLRRGP